MRLFHYTLHQLKQGAEHSVTLIRGKLSLGRMGFYHVHRHINGFVASLYRLESHVVAASDKGLSDFFVCNHIGLFLWFGGPPGSRTPVFAPWSLKRPAGPSAAGLAFRRRF